MVVEVQQALLAATDVSLSLGGIRVLKSVSFVARPGEVTGLIGPNGAGKSTLLRVLAGLAQPDSGSVSLGDTALSSFNPRERARRISYMPQHDAVHPFTALETVLMGRYTHLGRFELEGRRDRQIAREAMTRTETVEFENRQLDRVSGGERQRVILARALAQQAGHPAAGRAVCKPRSQAQAVHDGDGAVRSFRPRRRRCRRTARCFPRRQVLRQACPDVQRHNRSRG